MFKSNLQNKLVNSKFGNLGFSCLLGLCLLLLFFQLKGHRKIISFLSSSFVFVNMYNLRARARTTALSGSVRTQGVRVRNLTELE